MDGKARQLAGASLIAFHTNFGIVIYLVGGCMAGGRVISPRVII